MNKQEIFTKVKNHLLTQMEKSLNEYAGCVYRGPNGLMCAVGCLIPDELYDPEMESTTYGYHFIEKFPEVAAMFDKGTIRFISKLQEIHDYINVNNWNDHLHNLAIQENLEF